jgi:outer membrane protein assembly factor BamB
LWVSRQIIWKFSIAGVILTMGLNSTARAPGLGVNTLDASDDSVAFQIDAAHSGIQNSGAPTPPLEEVWTKQLGGRASFPVIAQGLVFVTTGIDGGSGGYLWALDQATGDSVWGPVDLGGLSARAEGWSAPTGYLAHQEGRLLAATDGGWIQAFDASTGQRLWKIHLPISFRYGAPPVARGNFLYVTGGDPSSLSAIDIRDGQVIWTKKHELGGHPAVSEEAVYVASQCSESYGYDRLTGKRLFYHHDACTGGGFFNPVAVGVELFLRSWGDFPDQVLDGFSGQVIDTYSSDSSPIIAGQTAYFRIGSTLEARDRQDDRPNSQPLWSFSGDGALTADPLLGAGHVYVRSQKGRLYAVASDTGQEVWTGSVSPGFAEAGMAMGEGLLAVPAGDTLTLFKSAGAPSPEPIDPQPGPTLDLATSSPYANSVAYQIDPAHSGLQMNGQLSLPLATAWMRQFAGDVSYPLIVDDLVLVTAANAGSPGAWLHALDASNGRELWKREIPSDFSTSAHAAYDRGVVVVTNDRGRLWGYEAESGNRIWIRNLPKATGTSAWAFESPPTARNGVVAVLGSGIGTYAYVVGVKTGIVKWAKSISSGGDGAVALTRSQLIISNPCNAQSLNLADGAPQWRVHTGCSGGGGLEPVVARGKVFAPDGSGQGNQILKVRYGTHESAFSSVVPPSVSGSLAVFAVGSTLFGEHVNSNTVLWRFTAESEIATAPIIVGDTVFVGSITGRLYAVSASTGTLLWSTMAGERFSLPHRFDTEMLPGLVAARGLLIAPAGNRLVAFRSQR